MDEKRVIVWGIGNIAEVVYFYLTTDSDYEVCAFCVDRKYKTKDQFHGLPVVNSDDVCKLYPAGEYRMSIPIGYKSMNQVRKQKYLEYKEKGYSFITYISSRATYYGSPVGENCIIMENNVIQPYTEIGNNVIMWSGNHLGHHAKIEDHSFIASHVVIAGMATIGESSFLGINATVRDNIVVGKSNLIGAGALVLKNTEDYAVLSAKDTTIQMQVKSIEIKQI